jgi:hypothetical protein
VAHLDPRTAMHAATTIVRTGSRVLQHGAGVGQGAHSGASPIATHIESCRDEIF